MEFQKSRLKLELAGDRYRYQKTLERGHGSYALKFLISITVIAAMTDRIDQIIEKLHQLKEIRQQLVNAPMSEPGAWIHQYEVRKQYKKGGEIYWYVYAKWQANEPIFKRNPKARLKGIVQRGKNPEYTCHQHIGRVSSATGLGTNPLVTEAYQEWENRKRLDALDKALDEIENALIGVMPEKNDKA